MDFTMYDTLLELPLFQGLGKNDITEILTKVKFNFKKHNPGEYIIRQDEECKKVVFLLNGKLMAETNSRNKSYTFCELISTPGVIELYSLFGIHPRYHSSYIAEEDTNTLSIDKQYLLNELSKYATFKFNFANIICTRAQFLYQRIWSDGSGDLQTRFVQFIMMHSLRPAGYKLIKTKMEDLAFLLNDRRINLSRVLNEMQDNNLISLRRKEIEIPALEKLL